MTFRLPRDEFLTSYWDYRPGEHVSLIEPTQGGKTYLLYQLLDRSMDQQPHLRPVSLMPKPRDPATVKWGNALGFREVADWPPRRMPWQNEPRGYVLWPKHRKDIDPEANRGQVADKFRKCLADQYWQGDSITVGDDIYITAVRMGLNPEFEQFWTAGSAGGAGLWSTNQKPSGTLGGGAVSSFSYNAPTHLFLGRDPDERNRRRFSEIGGVDPGVVSDIVANELRTVRIGDKAISEKLYIDKRGPYLAIVGV